jgi:hypothetical protein
LVFPIQRSTPAEGSVGGIGGASTTTSRRLGKWDARGTPGVDREAAVGLTDIALSFELDTDADAATV